MEGRFISKDPLSFAGGDVNLYRYANGNPINFNDPTGLDSNGVNISDSVERYSTKYNDRLTKLTNFAWSVFQGWATGISPPSKLSGWTFAGLLWREMTNPQELDDPELGKDGRWHYPEHSCKRTW